MSKKSYTDAYQDLTQALAELGYPQEFAFALEVGLKTEACMRQMSAYLRSARPQSVEEIADEMLSIVQVKDAWVERKKHEYYEEKLNEFYNRER